MKKATLMVTSLFLVAGAAAAAHAQDETVRADVGFAFTAGSVSLPAGEYEIRLPDLTRNMLEVSNVATGKHALVEYVTRIPFRRAERDNLVFDRVGNDRYLSEINIAGSDGYLLPGAPKVTREQLDVQKRNASARRSG
jgi:hypothetical protein